MGASAKNATTHYEDPYTAVRLCPIERVPLNSQRRCPPPRNSCGAHAKTPPYASGAAHFLLHSSLHIQLFLL